MAGKLKDVAILSLFDRVVRHQEKIILLLTDLKQRIATLEKERRK